MKTVAPKPELIFEYFTVLFVILVKIFSFFMNHDFKMLKKFYANPKEGLADHSLKLLNIHVSSRIEFRIKQDRNSRT